MSHRKGLISCGIVSPTIPIELSIDKRTHKEDTMTGLVGQEPNANPPVARTIQIPLDLYQILCAKAKLNGQSFNKVTVDIIKEKLNAEREQQEFGA